MAKVKTKEKEKAFEYTATVKASGKLYIAKDKTVSGAIEKLNPGNVSSMVILTVQGKKKTKEAVIPTVLARRLFNLKGVSRDLQVKNASLLFDDI